MKKHLYNWYLNGVTSSDSGYGSGIEITTNLYTDRVNVVRNSATSNFTLNVPTDYFCAWSVVESKTQIAANIGSGLSGSFTGDFDLETVSGYETLEQGVKFYDLIVTATKSGNTFKRHFRRIFSVLPATFTEGQADLVWDLASSTSYKDGAGTDRPGYKIYVKGVHTGAGYLGLEQYRSSNPANPVHILFADGTQINTTASWCFRINFDCQNLIADATNNAEFRYAAQFSMTDAGSQMIRIEPVDTSAGSTTTTAGKNITLAGFQTDGNRFSGAGINVNFDTVSGSAIEYDTWSFDGFNCFNNKVISPVDEGLYIGRFNDQLVTGYAKPKVNNSVICFNEVDDSGGDGFQFGILFNSEIHNNTGTNLNYRNATDHRNLFQLVGCSSTYFYRNNLKHNVSEGGSTLWNIETGRGGGDLYIWSNLLVNRFTGSHANGVTIIDENNFDDVIEMNIYNNTIILDIENSIEVWRRDTGVVTDLNPLRIVDNAILNVNDPDAVVYINSPDQSGYTISNLFSQTSGSFGFTDYAGDDFKPSSLGASLFTARTSFTKSHICGNQDLEGYEFVDDVSGCYSGVTLQAEATLPDVTAPTLTSATIEDLTDTKLDLVFNESVTVTTSGWSIATDGAALSISSVSGSGTSHQFTLSRSVLDTETLTLSYSQTGNTVDASGNELAAITNRAITNNVEPAAPPVDVKINFFTGTASGWIATGATSPKPAGNTTQDFGQLGSTGVGLRALNPIGDTWNATGSSGATTGANTGIFPDAVLTTYWYASGTATPTLELYEHTGTPLTGNTFTIVLTGSRASISSRLMSARVNGGSWSSNLDVANNTANGITFTGVSAVAGVISVEIDSIADDFCYINGLTLISE